MKTIDKIKNWYRGERVEVPLPRGVLGLPLVHYVQSPTARRFKKVFKFFGIIGRFWLNYWQYAISTAIAILMLWIAYRQLLKPK